MFLGAVTAAAGPLVASLIGDYFLPAERGRIYGFILAGELIGAGFGFAVTGDIATLSWRAAFVILALPAFALGCPRLPAAGARTRRTGVPLRRAGDARGRCDRRSAGGGADPHRCPAPCRGARHHSRPGADRPPESARDESLGSGEARAGGAHQPVLIAASACGYYFLAGVQTFGSQFAKEQYSINQAVANLLLLLVGLGAIGGVLMGGALGDRLLRRGILNGRILVSAISAGLCVLVFIPALFSRSASHAVLWLLFAVLLLSAQNPPLDAARLDIMPPYLWGRAEAVRTFLRGMAQALAPLLFGARLRPCLRRGPLGPPVDVRGHARPAARERGPALQALRTYPRDVASAAAIAEEPTRAWDWPEDEPQPQ